MRGGGAGWGRGVMEEERGRAGGIFGKAKKGAGEVLLGVWVCEAVWLTYWPLDHSSFPGVTG